MSDPQDSEVDNGPSKRSRLLSQSMDVDVLVPSKRTRGRRGALKDFSEMPLDILFEILGHLHPLDLLRLARTTKDLRHILMSRTSKTVWKQALSNLEGLPECPNDLSEPQYAGLLFEHICHVCRAPNSQQVLWVARTRFCQKCILEKFDRLPYLPYFFLREIIPSTLDLTMSFTRKWHRTPRYYTEVALAVKSEYEEIETEELRASWLSNKVAAFKAIRVHGELCTAFLADLNAKRSADLSVMRKARCNAIMEKLKGLGWEHELDKMALYEFSRHPDVNQPKALTERAWQKMQGTLTTFMEKQRVIRIQRDRREAISWRCGLLETIYRKMCEFLPLNEPIPNIADVALLKSFRSLMLDTPYETVITLSDFKPLIRDLVAFLPAWREVADTAILDIVRKSPIGPDATFATLPLGTTLFKCSSCLMTLHYPRVLVHHCLRRTIQHDNDEPGDLAFVFSSLGCTPWNWTTNQNQIIFDDSAHRHAKAIFALYDYNPVPTYDSLQADDPFVECLTTVCSTDLRYKRKIMTITEAIYFSSSFNVGEDGHFPWRALGEEDQALGRVLVAVQLRANPFILVPPVIVLDPSVEAICMLCSRRLQGQLEIRDHLHSWHDISAPIRFQDFDLHLDAIRSFERSGIITI